MYEGDSRPSNVDDLGERLHRLQHMARQRQEEEARVEARGRKLRLLQYTVLGAAAGTGLALLASTLLMTDDGPLTDVLSRVEAAAATLTDRVLSHEPPDRIEAIPPVVASSRLESRPAEPAPSPLPRVPPPPPGPTPRTPEASGFAPYTVRPELKDRAAAARLVERYYPTLLKESGVEGSVLVALLVDTTGAISEARLLESSGQRALDEAALAAARRLQFAPALDREKRVPVWVSVPIVFTLK